MSDEYPHFPEPEPCGNYLCDQDHDGRCWTCGELWPCTNEKNRKAAA